MDSRTVFWAKLEEARAMERTIIPKINNLFILPSFSFKFLIHICPKDKPGRGRKGSFRRLLIPYPLLLNSFSFPIYPLKNSSLRYIQQLNING
jgi:hypothetical protein